MAKITDSSYALATTLDDDDIALVVQDGAVRRATAPTLRGWVGSEYDVRRFGAIGDGVADDTAAVQAAMDAAAIAPAGVVTIPPGTYLVGNLLFGDQQTGSQSTSPAGIVGHGYSSMLKAKSGTTGTLLKAWSVAGVRFRDFTVDASGIAGITKVVDTEWKPGTGGSVQNIYDGVFVQNFAGTGWFARNNNDCAFRSVVVRQPTVNDAQVGIDVQGAGGVLSLNECIWAECLLDVCSQNASLRACWGHGIRLSHDQTGDNVMHLDACYIYANESADACIWDSSPGTAGHWTRALTLTGTHFIVTTAGKSLFEVGLVAGVIINGCIVYASDPVDFFGAATVVKGGGDDVQVIINGLSMVGGDVVTLNPVADVTYQPILLDVGGVISAAPLIEDSRFLASVGSTNAALTRSLANGRHVYWTIDASGSEYVLTESMVVPKGWTSVDIDIAWFNASAGSGNVELYLYAPTTTTTSDLSVVPALVSSYPSPAHVAPAQWVRATTTRATGHPVTPGTVLTVQVLRGAIAAVDTLAGNIGVLGALVRRAS